MQVVQKALNVGCVFAEVELKSEEELLFGQFSININLSIRHGFSNY